MGAPYGLTVIRSHEMRLEIPGSSGTLWTLGSAQIRAISEWCQFGKRGAAWGRVMQAGSADTLSGDEVTVRGQKSLNPFGTRRYRCLTFFYRHYIDTVTTQRPWRMSI